MKKTSPLTALISAFGILVVALSCTTPLTSKEKTDVEIDGLLGKVKSVRTSYGNGEYTKTMYDEYGYHVEQLNYYHEEGRELKTSCKNTYNKNNKLIEKSIYNSSGALKYQVSYKYDEQGNNTEITTVDSRGQPNAKNIFVYDNRGNMVERCSYGASTDMPPYEKHSYTYDSRGNQVGGSSTSNSGRVTTNYHYEYDDKGNRTVQDTHYSTPSGDGQAIWRFEYDEKGNITKHSSLNPDGSIKEAVGYKYDNYGHQTEEHSINQGTESKSTYQYSYDEQGNWIEKIYRDTTLGITETIKREITYYK